MNFRKSNQGDVVGIINIISKAQMYFKNNNIDQWQNGYPNEKTIINDINNDRSYVLIDNEEVVATTVVMFEEEKTYNEIYEGNWLTNSKYATIHRIAVDDKLKGNNIASRILKEAEKICIKNNIYSIKIDTHEDNKSMQRLLQKNNYKYCGIIYLIDGNKRIAFEKVL